MLREKYLSLRKGVDNVKYLERICNLVLKYRGKAISWAGKNQEYEGKAKK